MSTSTRPRSAGWSTRIKTRQQLLLSGLARTMCRLEQRGFRPKQYSTDILAFESKWNQCASWLPPVSASNPRLPTQAAAAEGALLDRLVAAGVNASDVEAVKALAARARAAEL